MGPAVLECMKPPTTLVRSGENCTTSHPRADLAQFQYGGTQERKKKRWSASVSSLLQCQVQWEKVWKLLDPMWGMS